MIFVKMIVPSDLKGSRCDRKETGVASVRLVECAASEIGLMGLNICRTRGFRTEGFVNWRTTETIFIGEIQVPLIMRRATENRACAVFHQNKIRDVNRQLPILDQTDGSHLIPVSNAFLLSGFDFGFGGTAVPAFVDELRDLGSFFVAAAEAIMIRRKLP